MPDVPRDRTVAPSQVPTSAPIPLPGVVRPVPRGRNRAIAGAIIIAAIIVVSGLYFAGLLPFGPRPATGGSVPGPVTFGTARTSGDAFVQGYEGGGWQLLAAGALVTPATVSLPILAPGATLGNCTIQAAPGVTVISAPGFRGSGSSGDSTAWELLYGSSKGGLVVGVINGSAAVSATVSGGFSCLELLSALDPIPSTVADSPMVAQAVAAAGGSAFLSSHPEANLSMVLWGGVTVLTFSLPSTWRVAYSLCSLTATSPHPEPEFSANVSAAGTVTSSSQVTSNCTAPSELGSLTGGGGFTLPGHLGGILIAQDVRALPRPPDVA